MGEGSDCLISGAREDALEPPTRFTIRIAEADEASGFGGSGPLPPESLCAIRSRTAGGLPVTVEQPLMPTGSRYRAIR